MENLILILPPNAPKYAYLGRVYENGISSRFCTFPTGRAKNF